jgi:hypothetical protein
MALSVATRLLVAAVATAALTSATPTTGVALAVPASARNAAGVTTSGVTTSGVTTSGVTTSALPAFTARVTKVTKTDVRKSWRAGCPVQPKRLRLITMPFYGFDKKAHTGRLVVHVSVVGDVVSSFRKAYVARFPIRWMQPVDRYGGSDRRSMAADNTSAFNCRKVSGSTHWSNHAYGKAIDVNPRENPYVWVSGGTKHASPKAGTAYIDRTQRKPGMLRRSSTLVKAFLAEGWAWGGSWHSAKDYQHLDLD